MEENMKDIIKTFREAEIKAAGKNCKYDYFTISDERCGASIYISGPRKIKNALILVEAEGGKEIWQIENSVLMSYPRPFVLWTKGEKKAGICVGDRDNDNEGSYLLFDKQIDSEPTPATVTGVVAIEGYSVAFEFDWQTGKSYYLQTEDDEGEESDLYELMKKMYYVKENYREPSDIETDWPF